MKFDQLDFLNIEEIREVIISNSPNIRATLITKKLKKYCFFNISSLYIYDSELVVYEQITDKQDYELITIITDYLTQCLTNLNADQRKLLELEHKKDYSKFCENSNISKNLPQITTCLREKENKFGADFYEIHYKNGYIDLKTLEFKKRQPNKHFVTNYIKRNYIKSTLKERENTYDIINKIYPCKQDLETILFIFGSGITGKATKEQKILFLLFLMCFF